MINFLKAHKSQIIKLAIMFFILIDISVISLLILRAAGVIYYEGNEMRLNEALFDSFRNSWYSSLILIAIEIAITILLSFVPGVSAAFLLLIQAFFEYAWHAFFVAFAGILLSSFALYFIGRLGGYRICTKLLGAEDCQKATDLLKHKGTVYFPLMMVFPIFPDNALVMIAGTIRMSMKWFIPSIVIGRGIGIATIIFGASIIPYDKFTSPWHWVLLVTACIIFVAGVFYLAFRFNRFLDKRNKNK